MLKKKQGFIKKHITSPFKPLITILISLKDLFPLLGKKKLELDSWSVEARKRLKNPALANLNLGKEFFHAGKMSDAIFRFKLANFMYKANGEASYWLGKSFLIKGSLTKAKFFLAQAKNLHYVNEELNYLDEIYNQDNIKILPPSALYKVFFEKFAHIFQEDYIEHVDYKGIDKVFQIYQANLPAKHDNILDLGCGLGLLGKKIKEHNNNSILTGLDFAQNMVEQARLINYKQADQAEIIDNKTEQISENKVRAKVYDYIIKADLLQFQHKEKNKYNVIVARGIFNYISDLEKSAKFLSENLAKQGILIFYLTQEFTLAEQKLIKTEYSYPFFCRHIAYQEEQVKEIFKKYEFKLVSTEDFASEKYAKSKIFVYRLGS